MDVTYATTGLDPGRNPPDEGTCKEQGKVPYRGAVGNGVGKVKSGAQLRATMPAPHISNVRRFKDLSRPLCSITVGLSSGVIGFNDYLRKSRKLDDPACKLCDMNTPQTVYHVLLECPSLAKEREEMWTKMGRKVLHLNEILMEPAHAKHAALLVFKSRLLLQYRFVRAVPEEATDGPEEGTTPRQPRERKLSLLNFTPPGREVAEWIQISQQFRAPPVSMTGQPAIHPAKGGHWVRRVTPPAIRKGS